MGKSKSQTIVQNLLALCDIKINGTRPWDLQVHKSEFYDRLLAGGSLAFGESYMDGWWDCAHIDQFMCRVRKQKLDQEVKGNPLKFLWHVAKAKIINAQSKSRAYKIGEWHYDLGNDLFSIMLDKRMNYSCAYWEEAKTLDEAQEAKLELICRKMALEPGMNILDIGCGWGSFLKYAAHNYGVHGEGITVSKKQQQFARNACKNYDIDIQLMDYRDLNKEYDRIISIGMFEHVGFKNYPTYMQVVSRCLKADGLFLLHTIGRNISFRTMDPWVNKYIFPNGILPSASQITRAAERFFVMENWHSFGPYYDLTLMSWYDNFKRNWHKIEDKYDSRFYRMWTYYLLSAAGSFRARVLQIWQIVFSKNGVEGGYYYP